MIQAVLIFVLGTVFFTALLSPVVASLIIQFTGELSWPFSRVYDRVGLVVAVCMLIYLRRRLDLSAVKAYLLQDASRFSRTTLLLVGIALSVVFVLPVLPWAVDGVSLSWRTGPSVWYYLWKAVKSLVAGLVISVIEESFFRVVVFQNLKKYFHLYFAALLCSVFYAAVHFIRPDKSFVYSEFSLLSGFEYTLAVVQSAIWLEFLPALFGLLIVGLILCFVIESTNSLYLCIGLHSGWVFAQKMTHYGTRVVPGSDLAGIGTRQFDLVSRPEVWGSFVVTFCMLVILVRTLKQRPIPLVETTS